MKNIIRFLGEDAVDKTCLIVYSSAEALIKTEELLLLTEYTQALNWRDVVKNVQAQKKCYIKLSSFHNNQELIGLLTQLSDCPEYVQIMDKNSMELLDFSFSANSEHKLLVLITEDSVKTFNEQFGILNLCDSVIHI